MIEFWAPAVLSVIAGVVSGVIANYAKGVLKEHKKSNDSLKYEIDGNDPISVPEAIDPETLQQRVNAFAKLSPRLAVLDGWNMVSIAILKNAQASLGNDIDANQDIVRIARDIPGITPETIRRIERLSYARNVVVHSTENFPQESLIGAVQDIVPALEELDARYRSMELA